MPSYKVDALVRLLQTVEARQGDDETSTEENVIEDLFSPLSETLNASLSVETMTFTQSQQVWGQPAKSTWLGATSSATAGTFPVQVSAVNGSVKLNQLASAFSRSSTAYLPTGGTAVASNAPRYGSGYFTNLWNVKDSWTFPGDTTNTALSFSVDPAPYQDSYTLSALVTVFPDDGAVNPHFTLILDYTDGTNTTVMVSETADGAEHFYQVTATPTAGKTIKRLRGWVLDYSTAGTRHASAHQIMLNPGKVAQTWRAGGTGKAFMTEEATTNLLSNGGWMDGTLTSWTSYNSGGAAGTRTVEADSTYTYRLNLNRTGQAASADRWGVNQAKTFVSPPGGKLTFSCFIKVVSASSGATFRLYTDLNTGGATPTYYYGGGVSLDLSTLALTYLNAFQGGLSITPAGNGWYRVTYTTTQSDVSAGTMLFWIEGANAQVYLAWSQCESKLQGYATTFATSTASRAQDVLTVPTTGLSNNGPWTMECWAQSNGASNTFRMPFTAWSKFYVAINTSNKVQFSWVDANNAQQSVAATSAISNPLGMHHWALTFDGATARLYVDGVKVIETATTLPKPFPPTIDLGRLNTNSYYWNGWIDDFRISTVCKTDAEVLASYNATAPAQSDSNTLALFPFDGDLVSQYPTGVTITSSTIDLGMASTSAPKAYLAGIGDADNTLTLTQCRGSSDGVNWTSWQAVDGDTLNAGQYRYWQVQAVLSTNTRLSTPTLAQIIVEAENTSGAIEGYWYWGYGGKWNA